ncbi:MAG: hypothetical protein LH481_11390 [Burkholderiales bacterium]|nr:hypothetical protein [Burkholderiales bacterium]
MSRIREIDRVGSVLPVMHQDPNAHPEQHRSPGDRDQADEQPDAPLTPKPSPNPSFGRIIDTFAAGPRPVDSER